MPYEEIDNSLYESIKVIKFIKDCKHDPNMIKLANADMQLLCAIYTIHKYLNWKREIQSKLWFPDI